MEPWELTPTCDVLVTLSLDIQAYTQHGMASLLSSKAGVASLTLPTGRLHRLGEADTGALRDSYCETLFQFVHDLLWLSVIWLNFQIITDF